MTYAEPIAQGDFQMVKFLLVALMLLAGLYLEQLGKGDR